MNRVDKMTDRELTVLAAQAIGIKPNLDLGGLLLDKLEKSFQFSLNVWQNYLVS